MVEICPHCVAEFIRIVKDCTATGTIIDKVSNKIITRCNTIKEVKDDKRK